MKDRRVLSASTLIGDKVHNRQGEELGKLEEIMLDVRDGSIGYAVLSYGGILGLGEKLFAVPWRSLKLEEESHQFVLDVDKERLEDAPGFDKNDWPDMTSSEFETSVHEFYGQERPYQSERRVA